MGAPLSEDELAVARNQLKERFAVSVLIAGQRAIQTEIKAERAFDAVMDAMRFAEGLAVRDVEITCRWVGPA